jgi:hypothetical protein
MNSVKESRLMQKAGWIKQLFHSIDNRDTKAFLAYLTPDAVFRFGNWPAVTGKAAVGEAVGGFFQSIKALHHTLERTWELPDSVICHGMVTYTRYDDSTLTVPFVDIFELNGDLVQKSLIFIDASALYSQSK